METPINSVLETRIGWTRRALYHLSSSHSSAMKFLSVLPLLALAAVALADEERVPPTELEIETTYKPDDCPVTAKTGDAIKVHYVSLLVYDGRTWS